MNLLPRPNRAPLWAVLLVGLAYTILRLGGYGILEVGLAGMLVALALYLMIDWSISRRSEERTREYEAAAEDLRIIQEMRMMTPEQLAQIKETRIIREHLFPAIGAVEHTWGFMPGLNSPAERYTSAEVFAVWAVCTPECFAPLSTWDDGTRRRNCAKAMHDRWRLNGYLYPATGNRPALWAEGGYDKAKEELEGSR